MIRLPTATRRPAALTIRPLTAAECTAVGGGETKEQAVKHAQDTADEMIAILRKYGLAK